MPYPVARIQGGSVAASAGASAAAAMARGSVGMSGHLELRKTHQRASQRVGLTPPYTKTGRALCADRIDEAEIPHCSSLLPC